MGTKVYIGYIRDLNMEDTKECTKCGENKSLDEYHKHYKTRDGRQSRCKDCAIAHSKEVGASKEGRERLRRQGFKKRYGITYAEVEAMYSRQEGRCSICTEDMTLGGRGLDSANVDHCHEGGHIRGLLCGGCNRALGLFKDNPGVLRTAITYLENN